jgi:hypothetical protein
VRALLVVLVLLLACGPPPVVGDGRAKACRDAASCEKAILAARDKEVPALLAAYAAIRGDRGWLEVQAALAEGDVIEEEPPAPEAVSADALILALARHAGRRHVFVATRQLFVRDALAPHMLGLPPVIAAVNREDEVAIAAALDEAFSAAGSFDYVTASAAADRLREAVGTTHSEAALRGRFALRLLEGAGISLTPAATVAPGKKLSSAYAELLAVQLAGTEVEASWNARKGRILPSLSRERVAVLERTYGRDAGCDAVLAPPIEHPGDVAFASQLALSLDPEAAPGGPASAGKLAELDWLARYEKLVGLVDESGSAWSAIGSLLRQRGELYGLRAEGSAAYDRVTAMALAHVDALGTLAEEEPDRVQPLSLVTLAYQPGALADRRLAPALAQLVERLVGLKLGRAADVAGVFEAAIAALAAGMSYPPELQGTQLGALGRALSGKLGRDFATRRGWGLAGLWAGRGALGLLLREEAAMAEAARGIARVLDGEKNEAALARIAASGARYLALGLAGKLDATVSNPALFSSERTAARAALADAIVGLADGGPASPREKDLAAALGDLADGLVAAVGATLAEEAPAGPACAAPGEKTPALANALRRLQKKRRALLALPAFTSDAPASDWLARARLMALVLSDGLDLAGGAGFTVETDRARAIVDPALAGWLGHDIAELAAGGYLLGRAAIEDRGAMSEGAARALRALGALFGAESSDLWRTLAEISAAATEGDAGDLLTRYAKRAFAAGHADHGDLLLLVHLTLAVAREREVADEAVTLARDEKRPVYLPLLLYSRRADPKDSAAVMRRATLEGCPRADPAAVIAVERAIEDFRAGRRAEALDALDALLSRAPIDGLAVPRQRFRFDARQGDKILTAEHAVSFGSRLLRGSGTFQLGLGLTSDAEKKSRMNVALADPTAPEAQVEAARYYAHAAALTAVYAFVAGEPERAARAARRAVGVWLHGVRLGKARVASGDDRWTADATATLLLAGQLAADAGLVFLAGELWTLARSGLDKGAGDDAVRAILTPVPALYDGIAELEPVAEKAREALVLLAEGLPCTSARGTPEAFLRPRCDSYAAAMALRTADSLPALPRLKRSAGDSSTCTAWRDLDAFAAVADQGTYDPDLLVKAAESMSFAGRHDDAAMVVARQRHPHHCNPALTKLARELGAREELGVHLRADLVGVTVNCGAPDAIDADIALLDELTQAHASPLRNLEVLLFACRVAVNHDRWQPLAAITTRPRFLARHQELGADVAIAALLVHHAAAAGAGKPIDLAATRPFHDLLCTTFPPRERAATCKALAALRGDGTAADKKKIAKAALEKLLEKAIEDEEP